MTARLLMFPTKKPVAAPQGAMLPAERQALAQLRRQIEPFITVGRPEFLDALAVMLTGMANKAEEMCATRTDPKFKPEEE